jgi:hypothetical protein
MKEGSRREITLMAVFMRLYVKEVLLCCKAHHLARLWFVCFFEDAAKIADSTRGAGWPPGNLVATVQSSAVAPRTKLGDTALVDGLLLRLSHSSSMHPDSAHHSHRDWMKRRNQTRHIDRPHRPMAPKSFLPVSAHSPSVSSLAGNFTSSVKQIKEPTPCSR